MSAIFRRLAIAVSILLSADACLAAEEVTRVSGRVNDKAGKPLSGVTWWISGIEVWRDGKWEVFHGTGSTRRHKTDENGRFEVTFHGKQRYDLQFDQWGYGPAFLFQVSPDSPDLHVIMEPGVLVTGRVEVSGKSPHDFGGEILVFLRLPNPRGSWFQRSTLVDHAGKFRNYASPPPKIPGYQEIPKWQVACAGEVVMIDVQKNRPADQVIFEINVKSRREPHRTDSEPEKR